MNELELKYGCNPNQKPSRIYMKDGSDLPITVLNGKPGYINFMDAFNSWQLVRELKAATGMPAAASFKHVSPAGAAVYRELSDVERNIYFLIAQAYLAQFYPIHTYQQTKLEVLYRDECFTASGRIIKQLGWKKLYASDKSEKKEETAVLPPVLKDSKVDFCSAKLDKKTTRPPTRFTAVTLLAAMKEIHRYVKNQDLKKKLKDVCGIGTEATRATMINELLTRGFLKEEKKFLVPTPNAYLLIEALPDDITYPDATAIWENALHLMKEGKSDLDSFLDTQIKFMTELCQKAETVKLPTSEDTYRCPQCKKGILKKRSGRNGDFWGCSRYPSCNLTLDDDGGKPKKTGFLCKQCKQGILRLIRGKNGSFWGCSNYPSCTATYNDENGRPALSRY